MVQKTIFKYKLISIKNKYFKVYLFKKGFANLDYTLGSHFDEF